MTTVKQVPFVLTVQEVPPPPDYFPAISPSNQSVFQGVMAAYQVSLTPETTYTGPVALSVANLPAGAVAAFSASAIALGETATLTIETAQVAAGTYALILEGTI